VILGGGDGADAAAPSWPGPVRGRREAQWRMVMALLIEHRPSLVAHMHGRSEAQVDKSIE
jgi:hypothetical protein